MRIALFFIMAEKTKYITLWFNFIFGLNFISFPLFLGMGMNVNDFETKENKIIPRIKRSARETLAKRLVGESTGKRRHHRRKPLQLQFLRV